EGNAGRHHLLQLRDHDDRRVRRLHARRERPEDDGGDGGSARSALPGERDRARGRSARPRADAAATREGRQRRLREDGREGVTTDAIRTAEELGLMAGAPPFDAGRLVTLANWQEAPFNRWAFQHVAELIPTARIPRGGGPVWELGRDERDLSGIT